MRDVSGGFAHDACITCGIENGYTALTQACAQTRRFTCANGGYWQPDFDRAECIETFDSRKAAQDHWQLEHLAEWEKLQERGAPLYR